MKKLEDFQVEKVDIKSIFGGKKHQQQNTFSQNTITAGSGQTGQDDGSDEDDDK